MGELTEALTDPARRPPEPRTAVPAAALQHEPAQSVRLTANAVAAAWRDTRRGGAAGLSGMRAEHLKLLLQDLDHGGCDLRSACASPHRRR